MNFGLYITFKSVYYGSHLKTWDAEHVGPSIYLQIICRCNYVFSSVIRDLTKCGLMLIAFINWNVRDIESFCDKVSSLKGSPSIYRGNTQSWQLKKRPRAAVRPFRRAIKARHPVSTRRVTIEPIYQAAGTCTKENIPPRRFLVPACAVGTEL
jgi:hypothetical protein